jgi:hypothetical protein
MFPNVEMPIAKEPIDNTAVAIAGGVSRRLL